MKVESNIIKYNTNDFILACRNLNQIHTYLNNEIKVLPEEDKLFLLTIFDGTYAGEVIKGIISQKKTKKKVQKDEINKSINPII